MKAGNHKSEPQSPAKVNRAAAAGRTEPQRSNTSALPVIALRPASMWNRQPSAPSSRTTATLGKEIRNVPANRGPIGPEAQTEFFGFGGNRTQGAHTGGSALGPEVLS